MTKMSQAEADGRDIKRGDCRKCGVTSLDLRLSSCSAEIAHVIARHGMGAG